MLARPLFPLAALILAPVLAFAQTPKEGEPAAPPEKDKPSQVPPKVAERTDFQLSITTLDALRKKGVLTDEDYNAALRDLVTVGTRAKSEPTFVVGRFVTTLYGFLQGDFVHDTQRLAGTIESYGGNPTLQLGGTQAADYGRTVLSARSTRLGLRFAAPAFNSIRVTGNFEMDFLGNQPGSPGARPPTQSESSFIDNPTPRLRQGFVKVDFGLVSLWVGQTWSLFGWEAAFLPASVQNQGLPGQPFSRNPQFRLSSAFGDKAPVGVEIAVSAQRAPQFDAELPDLQGGLKLNVNGLTGMQQLGGTGTTVSPASIAVSGTVRKFRLATSTTTDATATAYGSALALDAFLPIIPAKERGGVALSLLGEATSGGGYNDLFTGLNGGAGIGAPAGVAAASYAPFTDIDAGLAAFSKSGVLHTINWRTLLVGAEAFAGPVILAANFSNVYSDNISAFTGTTWNHQWWWDTSLIVDFVPGFRMGAEFSRVMQRRTLGQLNNESRFQLTGWLLF